MTSAAAPALPRLLQSVTELAPLIRASQPEADRTCRLPRPLLEALAEAGLFRLWLPAALGGLEVDPPSVLRVVEAAAQIDGSTGWCLGPGNVSSIAAGYLPEVTARQVYGGAWLVNAAGSIAGRGQAVAVEGGYRLTGRWAFATNSHGCPWLVGFFTVLDGDTPRRRPDGTPDVHCFYFPAEAAEILDTWDTGGLRGTASNDIDVNGVVVPETYGFAMTAAAWVSGPLFRAPPTFWAAPAFAAIPLGIARAAIDALTELAGIKVPTGSRSLLREQPLVRDALARAEARLRAARTFFYERADQVWETFTTGGEPSPEEKALLGLACGHAAETSRDVVEAMYRAGGGSAVYRRSVLDRCLRDVHVAAQHAALGPRQYEQAARVFLGLPPA